MAQQRKSSPAKEPVGKDRAPQHSSYRIVTEIPTSSNSSSGRHNESSKRTEENNEESKATVSGGEALKNRDDNNMQMNLLSATSIHNQTQTAAKQRMQAANHQSSSLHQEATIHHHHHHQTGDHDAVATATDQILAPISGASNSSNASDQRFLLSSKDSSPTINMNTRIRPHKNICRFHQQQQQRQQQQQVSKRPVLCNNHHNHQQQHPMAAHQIPKLVNHNHNHHQLHQPAHQQQHNHQAHCVYHPAHPSHQRHNNQLLNGQQNHDCLGTSGPQQNDSNNLKRYNNGEVPFVVINDPKRERRDCNHQHNDHRPHRSEDDDDESRRRRRRRATNLVSNGRDLAEVIVHQQQQQQQQQQQNELQQPSSKRTTMRFISQLYFLIHLSAILSLLLHHKNLVTNETWRLQQQQSTILTQDQESRSTLDLSPSIHHVAKRRHQQSNHNNNRNETITNNQMPSHISQLPIPLMLSLPMHPHPSGTISSFLPVPFFEEETSSFPSPSQLQSPNIAGNHYQHQHQDQDQFQQQQQQHQQQGRARRTTLPQMLLTPGSIGGGDILVRLFGYSHARWALHYFLVYLLCSSIAMLVSLRLFSSMENKSRDCCNCNSAVASSSSLSSNWLRDKKKKKKKESETSEFYTGDSTANNLRSPTTTTTFSGFYYRTRLDCTPVLVGSISLGLIQLIVIGLDIAAKIDWFSSPSKSSISSSREELTKNSNSSYVSRWPNYLPFLQFAFVSLLMQYILSKVAKNNDQVAAKSSRELHKTALKHLANSRMPINGQQAQGTNFSRIENNKKSFLLLQQAAGESNTAAAAAASTRLINRQHQKHLLLHQHQNQNQMFKNNGKRRRISGLQNIALAHLLVTHILLWLMKLNSISLFQTIEPLATSTSISPSIYSYSSISPNNSRSRSLITPPIQRQQPNNNNNNNNNSNNINLINLEFQNPKLVTTESSGDEERTNRSRQLLATTSTTLSPEREFNRTERERILRTVKPPPPTNSVTQPSLMAVNLIQTNNSPENGSSIQQVLNKHQQISGDGQFRWPSISDQARSETIVDNSTHQRASLANGQNELKSERALRSAALMERPVDVMFPAINDSILISKAQLANLMELATKNVQRFQVPPTLTTPLTPTTFTTPTTTTTTTTSTSSTPTSTPTTPITMTTSSTTTPRPQFKSSIPKRMTAFRQIQKPTVLLANRTNPLPAPPIRTTSTTTMPTTTTTTTGSTTTTTRVPLDVTKIISLAPQGAKKQPVRIHVQRNEDNNELATAGLSSGGGDDSNSDSDPDSNSNSDSDSVAADYSIRKPQTTDTKNLQSDYDETIGEPYRGKAQTYSSTKRPFPSVESDDPLPARGQHIIYTDAEEPSPETRHTILERDQNLENNDRVTTEMIPSRDNVSSYDDDIEDATGEELDLDSLLPPVPNYIINETSNNEPQDESNQVNSVLRKPPAKSTPPTKQTANINATLPKLNSQILGRPRREAPLDIMITSDRGQFSSLDHDLTAEQSANDEQTKKEPTFSDYLLPIVYQYHILIIAILFNMWLDSLRATTSGPTQLLVEQNQPFERSSRRLTNSSSISDDSNESSPIRRRHHNHNERRSRSAESTDLLSADHQIHHRRRQRTNDLLSEETSSTLSRSNSLRASSERLLWVDRSGKQHRARRHYDDEHTASFDSSRSPSRNHRHHHHHHLRSSIIVQRELETPTSSACSVFSGLLIVSAALIVIMLGLELLTLLNQCLTQLLSILVCLVGLCLVWRSQARQKHRRRRADELLSSASRHRRRLNAADGRKLLLSRIGAAYLTNPHDIVLSAPVNCRLKSSSKQQQQQQHMVEDGGAQTGTMVINQEIIPAVMPTATSNHRQCFHYLFLLAAYFCGVSIALNLGKQHSVQQLFPPHIMQFLQRHWLQATTNRFNQASSASTTTNQGDSIPSNASMFLNWGLFWSPLNSMAGGGQFPPMILFHVVLASKGLLLILQVTLQTILIRASCSQRATRKLRQVYTFLMFSNLSLWAMDICEQQQHLQRQDNSLWASQHVDESPSTTTTTTMNGLVVDRIQLITLEGFTQFACSIVTLSHLYHGLVFMQH